jgi:hypothetical protein
MEVQVPIPTGSYQSGDVRASVRRLVNCFAENGTLTGPGFGNIPNAKQDNPVPVVLRRAPGISSFANDSSANAVRGMWMMASVEYVVIGQTLYSVSSLGVMNVIGTGIVGTGLVRMTDNTQCLVILIPGTTVAYTYTVANGFAQLTDPGFTSIGAIDMGFIDSFIVFLALNGREFFNDDGQITSGTGPITFTNGNVFPREFGTDKFVGMSIENRMIVIFGERTSEMYVNTGASSTIGSPFSNAPDGYLQIGMLPGSAYTAVNQDNTVFWVANDRTIRRLNGQTPVRISNHGIECILESIDPTGSYALAYSIGGHLFAAFTFPAASRTLVYDCTTGDWHEMSSQATGYWRPLCVHNAFGKYLVGDSQAGQIGILDSTVRTEWGNPRTTSWIHQFIYSKHNRISFRRLELVFGGGFAPLSGSQDQTNPFVSLSVSDDGGERFRAFPMRSLGTSGKYNTRATWFNAGMGRDRVFQFSLSSDALTWFTDLTADIEPGRW